MEIHEMVIEMKLLERRLTLYEEKYGLLSEDFYAALMAGKLADYDAYDETRADFSRWKGIFESFFQSFALKMLSRITSLVFQRSAMVIARGNNTSTTRNQKLPRSIMTATIPNQNGTL